MRACFCPPLARPLSAMLRWMLCIAAIGIASHHRASAADPIRALLVLGGCCHDYPVQQRLITEGISKRANVQWKIAFDPDQGTSHLNPVYENENWADGFDVIVHDECCSDVKDPAIIERILAPHRRGLPAVLLHCGMHSYRSEGYPRTTPWFDFTGVASTGHGPQVPIALRALIDDQPVSGRRNAPHPILNGWSDWTTIREELYNNSAGKLIDTATPLIVGKQTYKDREGKEVNAQAVVAWTNTYADKTRVFATSLGHNNETVGDERYLDLITRGLLWSLDKLDEEHMQPAARVLLDP